MKLYTLQSSWALISLLHFILKSTFDTTLISNTFFIILFTIIIYFFVIVVTSDEFGGRSEEGCPPRIIKMYPVPQKIWDFVFRNRLKLPPPGGGGALYCPCPGVAKFPQKEKCLIQHGKATSLLNKTLSIFFVTTISIIFIIDRILRSYFFLVDFEFQEKWCNVLVSSISFKILKCFAKNYIQFLLVYRYI